jgi:hypothetical protein
MICTHCKVDKPRDDFPPNTDHWRVAGRCRDCNREASQIKRHGLSAAQREVVARTQGGCRICGHSEPGSKGWVVDHDRIGCCDKDGSCPKCRRGVICNWCNSVLGYAFDRVATLRGAIAYLEAERTCDWHAGVQCAPHTCGNAATDAYVRDVHNERSARTNNLQDVDESLTTCNARRGNKQIQPSVVEELAPLAFGASSHVTHRTEHSR